MHMVVVETFKEIEDSLCVAQKTRDGTDERVVLFLKMTSGKQLSAELKKQIQMSIRKELSARHIPTMILQITDIPVCFLVYRVGQKNRTLYSGPYLC